MKARQSMVAAGRQMQVINNKLASNVRKRHGQAESYNEQAMLVIKEEASLPEVYLELILQLLAQVKGAGQSNVALIYYQEIRQLSKTILNLTSYTPPGSLPEILQQLAVSKYGQDKKVLDEAALAITNVLKSILKKKTAKNVALAECHAFYAAGIHKFIAPSFREIIANAKTILHTGEQTAGRYMVQRRAIFGENQSFADGALKGKAGTYQKENAFLVKVWDFTKELWQKNRVQGEKPLADIRFFSLGHRDSLLYRQYQKAAGIDFSLPLLNIYARAADVAQEIQLASIPTEKKGYENNKTAPTFLSQVRHAREQLITSQLWPGLRPSSKFALFFARYFHSKLVRLLPDTFIRGLAPQVFLAKKGGRQIAEGQLLGRQVFDRITLYRSLRKSLLLKEKACFIRDHKGGTVLSFKQLAERLVRPRKFWGLRQKNGVLSALLRFSNSFSVERDTLQRSSAASHFKNFFHKELVRIFSRPISVQEKFPAVPFQKASSVSDKLFLQTAQKVRCQQLTLEARRVYHRTAYRELAHAVLSGLFHYRTNFSTLQNAGREQLTNRFSENRLVGWLAQTLPGMLKSPDFLLPKVAQGFTGIPRLLILYAAPTIRRQLVIKAGLAYERTPYLKLSRAALSGLLQYQNNLQNISHHSRKVLLSERVFGSEALRHLSNAKIDFRISPPFIKNAALQLTTEARQSYDRAVYRELESAVLSDLDYCRNNFLLDKANTRRIDKQLGEKFLGSRLIWRLRKTLLYLPKSPDLLWRKTAQVFKGIVSPLLLPAVQIIRRQMVIKARQGYDRVVYREMDNGVLPAISGLWRIGNTGSTRSKPVRFLPYILFNMPKLFYVVSTARQPKLITSCLFQQSILRVKRKLAKMSLQLKWQNKKYSSLGLASYAHSVVSFGGTKTFWLAAKKRSQALANFTQLFKKCSIISRQSFFGFKVEQSETGVGSFWRQVVKAGSLKEGVNAGTDYPRRKNMSGRSYDAMSLSGFHKTFPLAPNTAWLSSIKTKRPGGSNVLCRQRPSKEQKISSRNSLAILPDTSSFFGLAENIKADGRKTDGAYLRNESRQPVGIYRNTVRQGSLESPEFREAVSQMAADSIKGLLTRIESVVHDTAVATKKQFFTVHERLEILEAEAEKSAGQDFDAERMYEKLYRRIERAIRSERRRVGL